MQIFLLNLKTFAFTNVLVFQLQRNILGSQPRVTKFKIDWDDAKDSENIPPSENGEGATSSSLNAMDMKPTLATESSNSACAMEVA